jgi:hypothetical protein
VCGNVWPCSEDLNGFVATRIPAVVDLAEIEDVALSDFAVRATLVLDNAPVAWSLPFFFRAVPRKNILGLP